MLLEQTKCTSRYNCRLFSYYYYLAFLFKVISLDLKYTILVEDK